MKKTKSKMFIEITKKNLITVECQDCHEFFGINPDFIHVLSEVNFKYTCPYCGNKHLLKND